MDPEKWSFENHWLEQDSVLLTDAVFIPNLAHPIAELSLVFSVILSWFTVFGYITVVQLLYPFCDFSACIDFISLLFSLCYALLPTEQKTSS